MPTFLWIFVSLFVHFYNWNKSQMYSRHLSQNKAKLIYQINNKYLIDIFWNLSAYKQKRWPQKVGACVHFQKKVRILNGQVIRIIKKCEILINLIWEISSLLFFFSQKSSYVNQMFYLYKPSKLNKMFFLWWRAWKYLELLLDKYQFSVQSPIHVQSVKNKLNPYDWKLYIIRWFIF